MRSTLIILPQIECHVNNFFRFFAKFSR